MGENGPRSRSEVLQGVVCQPPECEGRAAEWGKGWRAGSTTKVNTGSIRKSSRSNGGRCSLRDSWASELEGWMGRRAQTLGVMSGEGVTGASEGSSWVERLPSTRKRPAL